MVTNFCFRISGEGDQITLKKKIPVGKNPLSLSNFSLIYRIIGVGFGRIIIIDAFFYSNIKYVDRDPYNFIGDIRVRQKMYF